MRGALILVALALLLQPAAGSRVLVVSPVSQEITSAQPLGERVVDFGLIGPGQKLEIQVQRPSGERAKNLAYEQEAVWDKLFVERESLPPAWEGVDSLFYEEPLKAFVIASRDAPDGEYEFTLRTLDELEGVEPLVFRGRVRVSRAVLEVSVEPSSARAGVGQPAVFLVRLRNKSSASDAYRISASGLPADWRYTRDAFVAHNSEAVVPYEVAASEAGAYALRLRAVSLSSDAIRGEAGTRFEARSSLWDDLRASAHGILLFPSVEQVVYSLLGLLANALR
jgi:hypothetical protein